MKKKVFILLGLVGFGIISFFVLRSKQIKYTKIHPQKIDLIEAIYGVGIASTDYSYELSLAVSTTVKNILVKEGDQVKKGTLLVNFEDTGSFYAPFSGIITSINMRHGELVTPNHILMKLQNYDTMYFEISLNQESAIQIKPEMNINIRFEKFEDEVFNTQVLKIFPQDNAFLIHTYPIKLPKSILPGMTADLAIEIRTKKNVTVLPTNIIQSESILVENRNGDREKYILKLGVINENFSEIISPQLDQDQTVLILKEKK